ncbi:hypothetical protein Agub_g4289 [Astrephomene gubernaculifera]|uniref:Uncharacterized protein n=1 Tax=Astrephomene gubernaculifera TaxID=47775 RepID=A0AAD3DJW7_9CHLO|nr:hypothetical protein Agub_g4289 [Astrephomene gubernaculifera]
MGGGSQQARLLQRLSCCLATRAAGASPAGLLGCTSALPALPCFVARRLLSISARASLPKPSLPLANRTLPLLEGLAGNAAAAAASQAFPAAASSSTSLAPVRFMATATSASAQSFWNNLTVFFFAQLLVGMTVLLFGPLPLATMAPVAAALLWFDRQAKGLILKVFLILSLAGWFYGMWSMLEEVPYVHRTHMVLSRASKLTKDGMYVPGRSEEEFFAEARTLAGWWNQLLPADHPDVVRVRGVLQRLAAAAAAGRGGGQYDHITPDMPWAVAVVAPVVGASEEQRYEQWMAGRGEERREKLKDEIGAAAFAYVIANLFTFDYPTCVFGQGENKTHEVLLNQHALQLAGEDESLLAAVLAHRLAEKLARHEAEFFVLYGQLGDALLIGQQPEDMLIWFVRELFEADRIAVHLLSEAGYDPAGMARWLERMQEQEQREQEESRRKNLSPPKMPPLQELRLERVWRLLRAMDRQPRLNQLA